MNIPGFKNSNAQSIFSIVAPSSVNFTKQGNITNAYLNIGQVPSDNTGFPIRLNNTEINYAAVQTSQSDTFTITVYSWDGTTETTLLSISVTAASGGDFTPSTPISVPTGRQLRARVSSGSCKDPIVQLFYSGELAV